MLLANKRVAIVGGGPGGLTLARLLQIHGVDVSVYERDLNRNARVQGAPLDLHDESGIRAITEAGLLEDLKQRYMPGADRKKIMNAQADMLLSDHDAKPEENFGHAHFRPEIDRGELRTMLLDSLQPGTVVWNRHFLSLEAAGEGWMLNFKNAEPEYADVVIAADGAHSKIRPYLTGIRPFYSGITMLEGNIPDAGNAAPRISTLLEGGKIMAFGNGRDILIGQKGNGEISFYLSFRTGEGWPADSGPDFSDRAQMIHWFRKEYADWSPVWQELLESAELPFIPRPIECMPLDQAWPARPNLTLLGDAAHVMPPFAGEGVNMAMLDALELCQSLISGRYTDTSEAIAAYEAAMRTRASAIARESLENGERMHSENALTTMLEFFGSHA